MSGFPPPHTHLFSVLLNDCLNNPCEAALSQTSDCGGYEEPGILLRHSQLAFHAFFQGGKMLMIQSDLPLPGFHERRRGRGGNAVIASGHMQEQNDFKIIKNAPAGYSVDMG